MNANRRSRPSLACSASLCTILVAAGCVGPDPDRPPPLLPLAHDARASVEVAQMRNEAATPEAAAFTVEASRMLAEALERSGRVEPRTADATGGSEATGPARFRLETALIALRDQDAHESASYADAQTYGKRRRAVVRVHYVLRDTAGTVLEDAVVEGQDIQLGVQGLHLPLPRELDTGAFWDSTYGRALRQCIDQVVRSVAGRTTARAQSRDAPNRDAGNPFNAPGVA